MKAEQRRGIRFLVQDDVFVALENHLTTIGKAKDVSQGGLSFEHIYEDDRIRKCPETELSLWVGRFRISKVSCRVVYDISVPRPPEYESLIIQLDTRRCGVQFRGLSEGQAAQLDFFLKTYTEGPVR